MLRSFSPLMRRTKVLIVPFADVDFLFPVRIVPNDQGPDALFDQDINQAAALRMQVVIDLAIALIRKAVEAATGPTFAQLALHLGSLLVVVQGNRI